MKQACSDYRYTGNAIIGLGVWLILFILIGNIGSMPVSADVVWSDDFNDGNYDGWTIYGYNFTFIPPTPADGEFSATDSTLKATGPVYNYAAYPSSVAYGTWSFRLHIVDTPMEYLVVFFLISDFSQFLSGITGYSMVVYMDGTFELKRHDGMPPVITIGSYEAPGEISGWQDIDVTRSDSGQFRVYINGTVQIEEEDSTYTTSDDFCFAAESGPAIDDVVVCDTIDTTTTTTTTPTTTTGTTTPFPMDMTTIALITGISIAVIVVIVIVLKRR